MLTILTLFAFLFVTDTSSLKILTPSLQERKTVKIELDNGLKAYLISDPQAVKSAAAMAVMTGYWDDPEEYPGMAHLTEHLLFSGSKAYPKEQEYHSFIFDHAGLFNAFTSSDRTVYMFSIANPWFLDGLDRFSHFFIDPLFQKTSIEQELHAVDQEHAKNIEHDSWRMLMVCKETGNQKHPNAKFSTGNSQTLSKIPVDGLRNWFESHYSPANMYLVIYSPLSIDILKSEVSKLFSQIPVREKKMTLPDIPLSSERQMGHITYIKPIKHLQQLVMQWEMPIDFLPDDCKGAEILAYALNRGHPEGLQEYLKKALLIDNLSVEVEKIGGKHLILSLSFDLTEAGLENNHQIIETVFGTLSGLYIPTYLFEEFYTLSKLQYEYQTREDPFTYTMALATLLPDEPFPSFPEKTILPTSYNPEQIQKILAYLTPKNCQYYLLADSNTPLDKKEKWMGVEYSIFTIPTPFLEKWSNILPNPKITIPLSNPYIPSNLELLPPTQLSAEKPWVMRKSDAITAYFIQDVEAPEIAYYFHILSPLIEKNAKSIVLTDLFLEHIHETLQPTLSSASAAGLDASIYSKRLRLNLEMVGYSEKSLLLTQEIFRTLKNTQIYANEFKKYTHRLHRNYKNIEKDLPLKQAKEALACIVKEKIPENEKLAALKKITLQELQEFASTFFDTAHIEAMLAGNITPKEGEMLLTEIEKILQNKPYPATLHPQEKVIHFSEGKGPYSFKKTTASQGNAAILLIEAPPFSFITRAGQQILSVALSERFYAELRTKQMTGYLVMSFDEEFQKKLFQYFCVQSSTHDPEDLVSRFHKFLEKFLQNIQTEIPKERFEQIKQSQVSQIKSLGKNIRERTTRWDLFAFEYGADFDWINKRVQGFEEISYDDFLQIAHQILCKENTHQISFLYQGSVTSPSVSQ